MLQKTPMVPASTATARVQAFELPRRTDVVRALRIAAQDLDPIQQIERYEAILSVPRLAELLSSYDIGNIHWNKSLAHTKESHRFFNDANLPVSAFRHQDLAVEHMSKALSCYDTRADQEAAERLLKEMSANREQIVSYMEGLIEIPSARNFDPAAKQKIREQKLNIYQSGQRPHKFYVALSDDLPT